EMDQRHLRERNILPIGKSTDDIARLAYRDRFELTGRIAVLLQIVDGCAAACIGELRDTTGGTVYRNIAERGRIDRDVIQRQIGNRWIQLAVSLEYDLSAGIYPGRVRSGGRCVCLLTPLPGFGAAIT